MRAAGGRKTVPPAAMRCCRFLENAPALSGERIPGFQQPGRISFIFKQGETDMGEKGKKDKGKREQQKKAQLNPKEKRKQKKEKKK
jgi:hypothetical protein